MESTSSKACVRPDALNDRPPAPRAARPARPLGTRLDWVVGALVVVAFLIGQFLLYPGPHPYDPTLYFDIAVRYPDVAPDRWSLRIGLLAPLLLSVRLLGPSELALYSVPVAAGILLALSVYVLMLVLFRDRAVAAAAALVAVLSPSFLLNSAYLFPDTVASATFTAGFLCLVVGGMWAKKDPRLSAGAAAVAGFFFGWTYLIREFSPVLLPAVLIALALLRYSKARVAILAGTAGLTAAIELLYGYRRYGDPLIRIHELLKPRFSQYHHDLWAPFRDQVNDPVDAALVLPRLLLTWRSGLVTVLLLVAFLYAMVRARNRPLSVLAGWLFSYWVVMIVFALVRNEHGDSLLNVGNIRYWYPLLPPLAMGGMAALACLVRGRAPSLRRIFAARVTVLCVAALIVIPGTIEFARCSEHDVWRNEPSTRWNQLGSWLATAQADRYEVIFSEQASTRLVRVYSRSLRGVPMWNGRVRAAPKNRSLAAGERTGGLILAHRERLGSVRRHLEGDWSPIFVTGDEALAVFAHGPATTPSFSEGGWPPSSGTRPAEPGWCGQTPFETAG